MQNNFTRGDGILEGILAKKRALKANSLIPEDKRKGKILDIGCGSFPYFLSVTKFSEKYGIDPSLITSQHQDIKLSKIDVTKKKTPFNDSFFDVVTMLAVFEHIEMDKINFVLGEIKRVLKKGGTLLITTPAPWSDKLLHAMANIGVISKEEIHEHKSHYAKLKIENIIKESGFSKIKSGYFEAFMNMWLTAIK